MVKMRPVISKDGGPQALKYIKERGRREEEEKGVTVSR
jgi:hypothetical protein